MDENKIREIVREEVLKVRSLPTPLGIDTLFALKTGGFIVTGSVTLASGSGVVSDYRIKPNSTPLLTYRTHTNQGVLRAACTDGTLTITSTSGTDASQVHYLIIL